MTTATETIKLMANNEQKDCAHDNWEVILCTMRIDKYLCLGCRGTSTGVCVHPAPAPVPEPPRLEIVRYGERK